MKWGIIGFGKIARKFIQSISYTEEGRVVAIGSVGTKENDAYLKEHPEVILYRDYEALLEDSQVEAVYIALPHKLHFPWVMKALACHKAVLCEKPAVLTREEMEKIKEAVHENQTCFLEALKTKMNRGYDRLKKDLPKIGRIQTIQANFCSEVGQRKGHGYLYDPEQGGALYDIGSYLVGFVTGILNEEVTHITGYGKIAQGVDEHFYATLTFSSGAKAHLEGALDEAKERVAVIQGDLGRIQVPMYNRISEYNIILEDGQIIHRQMPIEGDDMTLQIQVLEHAVKDGQIEAREHTLEQTIHVVEILAKLHDCIYTKA